MLKIECSSCKEWINLPFHGEIEEAKCPKCCEPIPVKDIYVSAGPYLIFKDVLLKNMYKYKRLILEAEKEIEDIRKGAPGLKTSEVTINSMRMFISNLKEMLDGCRDNQRHRLNDTRIKYTIDGKTCNGTILDISLSGICIDAGKTDTLKKLWNDISILFDNKESAEPFIIHGKIVWVGKETQMGIKFVKMDKRSKRFLEDYILEKLPSIKGKPHLRSAG